MKPKDVISRYYPWLIPLILLFEGVLYLGYTLRLAGGLGFPLDDSWIHQTIARNLVTYGQFVYNPGELSSGSTAPLWTLLLAVGYIVNLDFKGWAYLLGLLFHGLGGWMVYLLSLRLFPSRPGVAIVASIAFLLEWHLAWAALSGMETSLFIFLSVFLLYITVRECSEERVSTGLFLLHGIAGGLIVLTRPEGIVLFFMTLVWSFLNRFGERMFGSRITGLIHPLEPHFDVRVITGSIKMLVGPALMALVFVVPYLLFNLSVVGQPLPGTYYAKNSVYAQPLDLYFAVGYVAEVTRFLLFGPTLLVIPGLIMSLLLLPGLVARSKSGNSAVGVVNRTVITLPLLWIVVLVIMYMIKLPALYQHGRYLMPILPIVIMFGIWGLTILANSIQYTVFKKAYVFLAISLFVVLYVNGSTTYGWNVKFINDEHLAVAKWLKENTPANAIIATHDIGALGYFSQRKLFDTAGLINPEVAPYARDQSKLLEMARQRNVEYFAIIPNWYPRIAADQELEEVYRIAFESSIVREGDNMVVLRVR